MVRMLRAASLTLTVLLCAVSAFADASQPVGYAVEARYNGGRYYPAATGADMAYLVRDRAPWDPGSAVVLRLRGATTVRTSAMDGADVLAALPFGDGLIAVLHDRGGHAVVALDTSLAITSRIVIPVDHREGQAPSAKIIGMSDATTMLMLVGSTLCAVTVVDNGVRSVRIVEQGVSGGAILDSGEFRSCYVHQVGAGAVLAVTDSSLRVRAFAPVPRALRSRIQQCGSRIAVLTPIGDNKATQVTLVDPRTSRTEYATVDAPVEVVTAYERDSAVMIALVRTLDDRYELVVRTFGQVSDLTNEPIGERLTIRYFQPMALRRVGETLFLIFSGGLFTATLDGVITSSDDLPNDAIGVSTEAAPTGERLVLRGDRGSLILSRSDHPFWMVVSVVQDTGRYAVPIILLAIIGILVLRNRRQHRLLDAMMDLPGSGMVIWIDPNGKLKRANQSASTALGITPSVPMRRLIQYYMQNAALTELLEFTTAVQATRGAMSEKVSIQVEGAAREYVFSSVPLRTAVGRYLGSVITGVDITEALERKRLVNWAQLAHDMQTNLSTIRLNAEQLNDETPQNVERRRRILYQVGILIQRVRDLVAVGRSDELDRSMVHSAELCTEIRHEFDPAVFPHVTFSMKLRGTMMVVDRQKIMRAIRNAVENGIKALRGEQGVIEMATWFDRTNVYIRISDTGVGMDASTLQNMMKPYFTTAHDGGGTGIGTMIMQHVVHAHGGSLRVTSEPDKGTQIVFRIPHGMEPLRKRAAEDVLEEVL